MEFMALFQSDRAHFNMLTILGLLIVSIPDTTSVIKGLVGETVLLPCFCETPDETQGVTWQVHTVPVLYYKEGMSMPQGDYRDRAKILLTESKNNCSLLLSNVTLADEGKYKCTFYKRSTNYKPKLKYLEMSLQVSVSYTVRQGRTGTVNTFQCNATGRYPGQIQWELDGQPLTNPSTNDSACRSSDSSYRFSSQLTIELTNGSAEPQCVIVNPSANISKNCSEENTKAGTGAINMPHGGGQQSAIVISCVIVGISLLLLSSVVLYRCQRSRNTERSRHILKSTEYTLNASDQQQIDSVIH